MSSNNPWEEADAAPATAKDAVLVPSEAIPEGAQKVRGIEFNDHHGRDISVAELVEGMSGMGFQASAVGDAVKIINEMVCLNFQILFLFLRGAEIFKNIQIYTSDKKNAHALLYIYNHIKTNHLSREPGAILQPAPKPPSS